MLRWTLLFIFVGSLFMVGCGTRTQEGPKVEIKDKRPIGGGGLPEDKKDK